MKQHIFNNKLKQQGWSQMNNLLDKEMPVKKNNWKLLFLLIFILIGIGVGLGLNQTSGLNNNQKISIQKTQTNSSPKTSGNKQLPVSIQNNNINEIIKQNNKNSNHQNKPIKTDSKQKLKDINNVKSIIENKKILRKENPIASGIINKQQAKSDFANNHKHILINNTNTNSITHIYKSINHLKSKSILINYATKITITPELKQYKSLALNSHKGSFFNPFVEVNAISALNNYPAIGLAVGNRLYWNNRFYLDLAVGFTDINVIAPQIDLKYDKALNSNTTYTQNNSFSLNEENIKGHVFKLSLKQSYRITQNWNISLGTGLVFTKKINTIINNNITTRINELDVKESLEKEDTILKLTELSNIKIQDYTLFSDISTSYRIFGKLYGQFGYKYYFNKNSSVYYKNNNLYRSSITKSKYTGLYLGIKLLF